jgi:hypothetical protein
MRIVRVIIVYYAQSTTHVDSAWLTMPMASLYFQHSVLAIGIVHVLLFWLRTPCA